MSKNNISATELNNNLKNRLIIDVRESNEYKAEHILYAINIPLSKINYEEIKNNRNGEDIILYCQSGKRSLEAYNKVSSSFNDKIYNLSGGINNWKTSGYSISFYKKLFPIDRQTQIIMGSLVLLGIILSVFVNNYWLILSGIISLGLINAGITGWCGLGLFIAKMPWNKV